MSITKDIYKIVFKKKNINIQALLLNNEVVPEVPSSSLLSPFIILILLFYIINFIILIVIKIYKYLRNYQIIKIK